MNRSAGSDRAFLCAVILKALPDVDGDTAEGQKKLVPVTQNKHCPAEIPSDPAAVPNLTRG